MVQRAASRVRGDDAKVAGLADAEEAGLVFAFRTRTAATLAVALAMLAVTRWPRELPYLGFAAGFLALGYLPFRMRRSAHASAIRYACTALDVALITAAVLNVPAGGVWLDWPVQTRLRSQNFLLLLMLLGEAALTYAPRRVLWTGGCIAAAWTASFVALYSLPDTVGYGDIVARRSDEGLLASYLSPTYVSLPQWGLQMIACAVLTTLLATAVQRSRSHLLAQVRAEVLRSDLARYVSPDVAEALAAEGGAGFGNPASRQVSVLFADIVGFTGLSERLPPRRTFDLLRAFQDRAMTVVFRHRGTLDKFLGDGLMATFGALRDEEDAAARAIACAFDLRAEMERWDAERGDVGTGPMRVSIGVHHGTVVVGNVGAARRVEFTAIGDVVNVASRLEQMTRRFGCAVVVSEACVAAAGSAAAVYPLDRTEIVLVRGRTEPLRIRLG